MRCPNCGGERIVRAAPPGLPPDRTCVCLACAFLWEEPPRPDGAAAAGAEAAGS